MNKLLIKDIEIINEGIRTASDKIGVNIKSDNDVKTIDGKGYIAIPGMIDDQVHFRQPGLTHKGDISSESKAAIAGGVTSYFEMPNTFPNTTSIKEFENKIKIASDNSFANFSFMFGGTNDNINEIRRIDKKQVAGIKLFLGSSTGKMLIDNKASIENIFNSTSLPISAHCEDEQTIKDNTEHYKRLYGEDIPISAHPEIRNEDACYKSSNFAVNLAKKTGARLNVFHISTDDDYDRLGSKIKWNPAIKSKNDRDALWQAINDNKIDIIASDHAPHTIEEKNNKYLNCPSGGPMVQHTILSLLQNCEKHGVSIEKIVEKISHNPATIFKVNNRGFLREGYYADIVLIDINTPTVVSKESLLYKCGWSPFEGEKFDNSIHKTILNGNVVYENGIVNSIPYGKKITFNR